MVIKRIHCIIAELRRVRSAKLTSASMRSLKRWSSIQQPQQSTTTHDASSCIPPVLHPPSCVLYIDRVTARPQLHWKHQTRRNRNRRSTRPPRALRDCILVLLHLSIFARSQPDVLVTSYEPSSCLDNTKTKIAKWLEKVDEDDCWHCPSFFDHTGSCLRSTIGNPTGHKAHCDYEKESQPAQ